MWVLNQFDNLGLFHKLLVVVFGLWAALYVSEKVVMYRYSSGAKKRGLAIPRHHTTVFAPYGLATTLGFAYGFATQNILETVRGLFQKEGDTFIAHIGGMFEILTDHPDNIQTVLATSFKDYTLGERYNMFFSLLGNGIFTLSGEGWKHSRAMLRPQFSREQISHISSIKQHAEHLMSLLAESGVSNKLVDAQAAFHAMTLDTASEFLFGESTESLQNTGKRVQGPTRAVSGLEFGTAFADAQDVLSLRFVAGTFWRLINTPAFRRNTDICKNFIDYFVFKALEKPMEKDEVADKFVFMRELTKETRDPVVIRDQAFNILLAGRDTTASTMSFMALYLSRNKDIWLKLREAVFESFGPDGSTITFESLKHCKYLNDVIREVLRLHPVVPLNFRQAVRDTELPTGGGPNADQPVYVPKGAAVFYSPFVMQRNPRFWGSDADEFKPDRWNEAGGHTWSYLPFNGGPRICLGQQFALTEIATVWVRLAQKFKDFDVETALGDFRHMKQNERLTVSVSGGVPSKWYRDDRI